MVVRDKPSEKELVQINAMSRAERVQYFLHCVIETEDVWGLGDNSGWLLKSLDDDVSCLPIWPFKDFALKMNVNDWDDQSPVSVSLEHFIYGILGKLKEADMLVEIFPTPESDGDIMTAQQLSEMLEGMLDAGEYYMEG